MSRSSSRIARLPGLSRFGWLMGMYAENHQRIVALFDPARLPPGDYVSSAGDGIDLHLSILEQHRYTTALRLSYAITDPVTGEPDPSAWVRLYRDAAQAEATHCYVGRRWQDAIGMHPDPDIVFGHRLRMNTFLGKWLQYLAERGHGADTLSEAQPGSLDVAERACVG